MKEQCKWETVGYTPSAYSRFANLLYFPQVRAHRAQQLCFLRPPHPPFPLLLPHMRGGFSCPLASPALSHPSRLCWLPKRWPMCQPSRRLLCHTPCLGGGLNYKMLG